MRSVSRIIVGFLALCLVGSASVAGAEKKLRVVASFTILSDMVKNVGGDRVALTTLVGPNGDAHVYEPTPADARALSAADLVVVNGLGMEGWMNRLVQASGYKGQIVVATKGIIPRKMTSEENEELGHTAKHKIDPHAWQNLANGIIYVDNITRGLIKADPSGAAVYEANAAAYKAKLTALDQWVKREFAAIPQAKRRMITSHDALGYFGPAYGVEILSPVGFSTESEASAGDIARLIQLIRQEKITAVFIENVTDPRLMQQVARESGVAMGGELYSDALSKPEGPAATYIDMFNNNVPKIVAAMTERSLRGQ